MKANVCVLGAGRMGSAIVRTFLKNQHPTWVWNRTASKSQSLAAEGAAVAPAVQDAVLPADVVVINVLDYAASDALLKQEAVASLLRGKSVVQLTSGSPRLAREDASWVEAQGARYLDGAIMATPNFIGSADAALLYSGSEAAFEEHRSLLLTLGGRTSFVGKAAGQASALDTALLTQMWGTLFGALQGVAVVQAEGLGLDIFSAHLAAFKPVVDGALLDVVKRVAERRLAGDGETLASLGAHYSTFQHLLEACEEHGIDAALPQAMDRMFQGALSSAGPDADFAALAPLFGASGNSMRRLPEHADV